MKYLGSVKVTLLKERQEYKEMFPPLSEPEYADLRESIREAGVLDNLILDRNGDGYVILSGHHRKAIARELGLEEVPCSLAETPAEIVEALFENANRRQMTEAERKEKIKKKEKVQDWIYEKAVIPDIYELYKEGKIERKLIDQFVGKDPEVQRSIFHSLSIELPVVPEELLEKHEQEIASIKTQHQEALDAERKKLAMAEAEKKKAEEALQKDRQELEKIRERAKNTLARYEKNKEEITVAVRKEFEKDLADLEKERESREAVVKAKQEEIGELNGKIASLNNNIYGLDSQVALWRHEVARIVETYDYTTAYYSNPALIEIQLRVISEFAESLIRFSECHKWDEKSLKMVEKYDKSIGELLHRLVKKVAANQKEVLSLEVSEKAVAAQSETRLQAVPKAQ